MSFPPSFFSEKNLLSKPSNLFPQNNPNSSYQPLFQKRNFFNTSNDIRPESAKQEKTSPSKSKRKHPRPITSNKNPTANRRVKITPQTKSIQGSYLSRLKPRHIPMDKERLYEQNMSLKQQNNHLASEMVRVKTKINQMQRELLKKTEQFEQFRQSGDKISKTALRKIHIVASLKNTIRDLRQELKLKERQNSELKKNLKSSRIQQQDVQINAYVDECARLRHHLQEIMRQKEPTSVSSQNLEEKAYQQTILIRNLKKQSTEILAALEKQKEEAAKWKQKFNEIQKKKKPFKKSETLQYKNEIQKLRIQLENLGTERKALENSLKEENQRLKQDLLKLQRNCSRFEQEVKNKNQQISKLKQTLVVQGNNEKPVEKTRQIIQKLKNPPKLFKKIHQILTQKNMLISVFLSLMDKNHNGIMEAQQFIQGMLTNGKTVKKRQVQQALLLVTGKSSGPIRLKYLEECYQKYDYSNCIYSSQSSQQQILVQTKTKENTFQIQSKLEIQDIQLEKPVEKPKKSLKKIPSVSFSQVKSLLDHISLRMQLHRIGLKDIMQTILLEDFRSSKTINQKQLQKILSDPPFSLKNQNTEKLQRFLLQDLNQQKLSEEQIKNLKAPVTRVQQKLQYFMQPWEVFSTEDQEQFDREIYEILAPCGQQLLSHCSSLDEHGTGVLNLHTFQAVTQKLKISFPKQVFQYMLLLFYSHNYELNKVPYQNFIGAYSTNQENILDQQEKASIVRDQLSIMAKNMLSLKKSPKDVFQCSQNSLIYPKEFIQGLKDLQMDDLDENIVQLMIDSLRYDQQQDLCLHLEQLEDILVHYGVPRSFQKEGTEQSKPSSTQSVSVQQKMSVLESPHQNLMEYSEQSAVKPQQFTTSGLSDISPFQTVGESQNITYEKTEERQVEAIDQISDQYDQDYDQISERSESEISVRQIEKQITKTQSLYSSESQQQEEKEGIIKNLPILESVLIEQKIQEKQKKVFDQYSKSPASSIITQNLILQSNLGVKQDSYSSQNQQAPQSQLQLQNQHSSRSQSSQSSIKISTKSYSSSQIQVQQEQTKQIDSPTPKIENSDISSKSSQYQNSFQSQQVRENLQIQPFPNQKIQNQIKPQSSSNSSFKTKRQKQVVFPQKDLFSSLSSSQQSNQSLELKPKSFKKSSSSVSIPLKINQQKLSQSNSSQASSTPIKVQPAQLKSKPDQKGKTSSSSSQQASIFNKEQIGSSSSQYSENPIQNSVSSNQSSSIPTPKQKSPSPDYEEEFDQDSSSDISF